MRRILKKVLPVCLSLMLAAVFTIGCAAFVQASEESTLEQQMVQTAEGLTETIISLTDDEIESYLGGGDDFTVSAMTAWKDVRDELGEMKETGETGVSEANGEYTVTVPVSFENEDVEFEYVFDDSGTPTSMAVNIQYSLAQSMSMAGMNTVMGLGVVFVVLVFLCFVIWLFRFIPSPDVKKAASGREAAGSSAVSSQAAPAVSAVPVSGSNDDELAAVIAAAIAAYEADNAGAAPVSADGYVVRSIRKIGRKKR